MQTPGSTSKAPSKSQFPKLKRIIGEPCPRKDINQDLAGLLQICDTYGRFPYMCWIFLTLSLPGKQLARLLVQCSASCCCSSIWVPSCTSCQVKTKTSLHTIPLQDLWVCGLPALAAAVPVCPTLRRQTSSIKCSRSTKDWQQEMQQDHGAWAQRENLSVSFCLALPQSWKCTFRSSLLL